ncbi:hypothetical protein ACTHOQ_13030 [Solibacillus silvestris]|uniref:hypothetical protein n=1 Tax=Solibacillus silvestris TaxID=76853 RepID=UPI003F819CD6
MKKTVITLIVFVVICFSYFYKSPIISSDTALINAEKYLLNPSEEWGVSVSFHGLEGIPEENISANLAQKSGFCNELLNRMQWEVTIKSTEMEATVVMDAHTGYFMNVFGAFS